MSLDKNKTDKVLGENVHRHLIERGIETPMDFSKSSIDSMQIISKSIATIMQTLGLDLKDDSLCQTPHRVAKMYIDELFCGLTYDNFPKITTIENKMNYNNMLIERDIRVASCCEHHLLPILGRAYIGYVPDKRVIGLSKLNRIVEFFCRRPQVQERLTEQIFATLQYLLGVESVAVVIIAEHNCVKLRGVEDTNSDTTTSRLGGTFMESVAMRNEFFQLIRMK